MLAYAPRKSWSRTSRRPFELRATAGNPAERALRSLRAPVRRAKRFVGQRELARWAKLALIATVLGLFWIWQRTQVIKLGRDVHRLQTERRQLLDEVHDLRAACEKMSSYETVRQRTSRQFGFTTPPVRILDLE